MDDSKHPAQGKWSSEAEYVHVEFGIFVSFPFYANSLKNATLINVVLELMTSSVLIVFVFN